MRFKLELKDAVTGEWIPYGGKIPHLEATADEAVRDGEKALRSGFGWSAYRITPIEDSGHGTVSA